MTFILLLVFIISLYSGYTIYANIFNYMQIISSFIVIIGMITFMFSICNLHLLPLFAYISISGILGNLLGVIINAIYCYHGKTFE